MKRIVAIYGHHPQFEKDHKWSPVKRDEEQKIVSRLCEELTAERVRQGISQQELSQRAGISRTGLRHFESQTASPKLYTVLKISKALGVALSDYLR